MKVCKGHGRIGYVTSQLISHNMIKVSVAAYVRGMKVVGSFMLLASRMLNGWL